jgi:phosphomannomutase
LWFLLDAGARVIVRPSGTEPKIKCYLEVIVPASDGDVDSARAIAAGALEAIKADLVDAAGL